MELHFKKVCEENRDAVCALQLLPSQTGFIESVKECLAEAAAEPGWRPFGIYDGKQLIGFAMYGRFPDALLGSRVWMDRILIDKAFQGRGCGSQAAQAMLDKILQEYETDQVYLSVYEENVKAVSVYKKLGFSFNGELDTKGEKIMVYEAVRQQK